MSLVTVASAILLLVCLSTPVLGAPQFALYTATMDVPNLITIFSGDETGALTAAGTISTGANGWTTAGSIQSQDAISIAGNYLFVVNPGSNSVTMFSINPQDPTKLTLIGSASSGGQWPVSVAANAARKMACVVNSGAVGAGDHELRCFTFSATGLTVVTTNDRSLFNVTGDPTKPLTTPPGFHNGPAHVTFTPDGNGIVITNKGDRPATPFYLYTIDANGALSASATALGSPLPITAGGATSSAFAALFDPADANTIISIDPGYGVITAVIDAGVGTITPAASFLDTTKAGACWIAYSTMTTHYYVINTAAAYMTAVSKTGSTLAVVSNTAAPSQVVPSGGSFTDVTVVSVNGQDYAYVVAGKVNIIAGYKLTAAATGPTALASASYTTTNSHPAGLKAFNVVPAAVDSSTGAPGDCCGASALSAGSIWTIVVLAVLAIARQAY